MIPFSILWGMILLSSTNLSFDVIDVLSFTLIDRGDIRPTTSSRSSEIALPAVVYEQVWVGKQAVRVCNEGVCRVEYRDLYEWRERPESFTTPAINSLTVPTPFYREKHQP
ncbi:hypothetical protein K2X85_08050 [bacterium]|nr:hypothetical protein [bacterium]